MFCKFAKALNFVGQALGADLFFNFVDDILTAQKVGSGQCGHDLQAMWAACGLTGFQGKEEKIKGPVACLEALGIEVDTVTWELRISVERLQSIMRKLEE